LKGCVVHDKIAAVKVMSLEIIFRALNEAQVRYLVVGGVAVIAHGHRRFTEDLDLVLDLSPDSLARALTAFESLGYRPIVPVPIRDFLNPAYRLDWMENRNMKVFGLVSDQHPEVTIDIFTKEPFSFDREYARAEVKEFASDVPAFVVSVPTLIALKIEANRVRDLDDIEKLRQLHPGTEG
jgi:hypothetical protein